MKWLMLVVVLLAVGLGLGGCTLTLGEVQLEVGGPLPESPREPGGLLPAEPEPSG